MKKVIIFLLLAALLLTGCAEKTKIVVDTENRTISDGSHTYEYTDTATGDLRILMIRYPNGQIYTWTQNGNTSSGEYAGNGDPSSYTQGSVLAHAVLRPNLQEEEEQPYFWILVLVGGVLTLLGLLHVCFPHKIWDLFLHRWYHEDASNFALSRIIATGVGQLILGIAVILTAIFAR